jgi:hypothetical protein
MKTHAMTDKIKVLTLQKGFLENLAGQAGSKMAQLVENVWKAQGKLGQIRLSKAEEIR